MNIKSTILSLWEGQKVRVFAVLLLCISSLIMQAAHICPSHLVMGPPGGNGAIDPKK